MKSTWALFLGLLAAGTALAEPWTPEPWLADLEQMHQAFDTKYANRDWLTREREVDLAALFDRNAKRLRDAGSDVEARAIIDRMIRYIGDGHVVLIWPSTTISAIAPSTDVCTRLGYDANQSSPGLGPHLSGFQRLGNENDAFPAGTINVQGTRVGVLRISMFLPHTAPQFCRSALTELKIAADQACDERCEDAILTRAYEKLTNSLQDQLRALQAAGAKQLLVDITSNGGGSEWVQAAARVVSPRPLQSQPMGFVRGEHWAKYWRELGDTLRKAAARANRSDRSQLLGWAAEADDARQTAEKSCAGQADCEWVARAGSATGLVRSAPAGTFDGKPWGVHVFSPAQYPYRDSVWRGPVVVLVDERTGSAAEEFAAVLQDNRAAVIFGARTSGAGCGYTNGGTPTTLNNTHAVLRLPDCVRFRADGTNEVYGVIPDVLVGMRAQDGARFKAQLIEAKLPEALQLAEKQIRLRESLATLAARLEQR
jgi:hypothetical protein